MTLDFNPSPSIVKNNDSSQVSWGAVGGRARVYEKASDRVAACLARKNKKSATFTLSPEILNRLDAFMEARVDSKNPSEKRSEVVERALASFFRKR